MNSLNLKQQISRIESVDLNDASTLQASMAKSVSLVDDWTDISAVAGLDVGFEQDNSIAVGGIVVLSFPDFNVIEKAISKRKVIFPYQPGFLSFREVPVLLEAFSRLTHTPDLIICDGQGIAHPRRFGLACHLGLILDLPAIGAGKTRLIGQFTEPAVDKGATSVLTHKNEQIGTVLRTRQGTKPLFISPGHKISLSSAVKWTLNCCPKYRLPETTRHAHKLVSG